MDGAINPKGIFNYIPFEGEEFVKANGERFVYRGGHLLKVDEIAPHWVRCRGTEDGLHQWHSSGQCSVCSIPLQMVRGEGGSEAEFQRRFADLEETIRRLGKEKENQKATIIQFRNEKDALERMLETRDRMLGNLDAQYQALIHQFDPAKRRLEAVRRAVDPAAEAPR